MVDIVTHIENQAIEPCLDALFRARATDGPNGLPQLQFYPLKIAYHLHSIEKRPQKGKVNEDP